MPRIRHWRAAIFFVTALLGCFGPSALLADDKPVDLELVLAVDISRSIDDFEHRLQRDGYINALTDARVIKAIQSGPLGRIAVTYVEWSAEDEQQTIAGWQVIDSAASAAAFVKQLAAAPRIFWGRTSISGAVDYAMAGLNKNGFEGTRRVIDISGDGINNRGRPVFWARDDAVEAGVTINGLAIINDRPQPWPSPPVALDEYFRENVIGGPGAFLIVVQGFGSFGEAITRKLIIEIAGGHPSHAAMEVPAPAPADRP